jgi:uncharacterized membrane protein YfcA
MPYDTAQLVIVALVMTIGSVLQGAVGFASGLLGVPLLVLCGFPLLDATIINFVSTSVQNAAGAIQLWPHLEWRELIWPSIFRAAGMPLGIYALDQSRALDHNVIKQVVGMLLLVAVVLLIALRVRPRERLHAAWTFVAFLSSGFLTGFASIGGPPMVLYVNSLDWSAPKSRGFLFFCSAALLPLLAALFLWQFGREAGPPAAAALLVMPPVLVGLWTGLRLGHRLDKAVFRRLTYALVAMVAIAAIAGPMFKAG